MSQLRVWYAYTCRMHVRVYSLCVVCVCDLPVSCQEAQTGWADLVVEHSYLNAATAALDMDGTWSTLLHHPPLTPLTPIAALQLYGQGAEEGEGFYVVWPVRVLWKEQMETKEEQRSIERQRMTRWVSKEKTERGVVESGEKKERQVWCL